MPEGNASRLVLSGSANLLLQGQAGIAPLQPAPPVENPPAVQASQEVRPPTAHTTPGNLAWLHQQLKELRASLVEVDGSGELRDRITALALDIEVRVRAQNRFPDLPGADSVAEKTEQNFYFQPGSDGSGVDRIYALLNSRHAGDCGSKALQVVNEAIALVGNRTGQLERPESTARKVLRIGARILYGVGVALGAGGLVIAAAFNLPVLAMAMLAGLGILTVGGLAYRAYHRSAEQMREDLENLAVASQKARDLHATLQPADPAGVDAGQPPAAATPAVVVPCGIPEIDRSHALVTSSWLQEQLRSLKVQLIEIKYAQYMNSDDALGFEERVGKLQSGLDRAVGAGGQAMPLSAAAMQPVVADTRNLVDDLVTEAQSMRDAHSRDLASLPENQSAQSPVTVPTASWSQMAVQRLEQLLDIARQVQDTLLPFKRFQAGVGP